MFSSEQAIARLLGDPEFRRVLDLVTREVMRAWQLPAATARGFVLSAIGEPAALASIHDAWAAAQQAGDGLGLAKLIMRRRVIDLLRKDARQAGRGTAPVTVDFVDAERELDAFHDRVQADPRAQLELREVIDLVRRELACFGAEGDAQRRQELVLRRHVLDEVGYPALSLELACSEPALRVRVHKAMLALRRHIRVCNPGLASVLGARSRSLTFSSRRG
jgi:DNA-directed RNA polymerase specialized sigma24 family protein